MPSRVALHIPHLHRISSLTCRSSPLPLLRRSTSTTTSDTDLARTLRSELTKRTLPLIYDYLTPTPSHLLSLTLPSFSHAPRAIPTLPSTTLDPPPLASAHHLVYFPTSCPTNHLLPDGTDTLHYAGAPYTHRLWASGSLALHPTLRLHLDGSRAVCHETITAVRLHGLPPADKVFVTIERRYALCPEREPEHTTRRRLSNVEQAALVETRELVFLRHPPERSPAPATGRSEARLQKGMNVRRDYDWKWRPSHTALFRFSALTFNAHDIHLEGEKRLVHGPLTLAVLVGSAEAWLDGRKGTVKKVEYRNMKGLWGKEEMRVCGREVDGGLRVWIEDENGGVAVRGFITVE